MGQCPTCWPPAEYKWRPLLNAAKFGWRPLLECRAVTLPRREIRWNVLVCPKLANRSQQLVGRSSPYCGDVWRRYCCSNFFPIVDTSLSCEDIARQSCAMVPKNSDFLRYFCVLYFSEPRAARFGPGSYIRTETTPGVQVWQTSNLRRLRLGVEKKETKKKPQGKNIMSASATQGGHNSCISECRVAVVKLAGRCWAGDTCIILAKYGCDDFYCVNSMN